MALLEGFVAVPLAIFSLLLLQYIHGGIPNNQWLQVSSPKRLQRLIFILMSWFQMIEYLPIVIRWKWFYSTASSMILQKHIRYARSGAEADLCHTTSSKQVVIFLYGGAWSSGDKASYGLLAREISEHGPQVLVANYTYWPRGDINVMLRDVLDAVLYVNSNLHSDHVTLMGHSSGAHLACLLPLALHCELLARTQRLPDIYRRSCFEDVSTASLQKALHSLKCVVGLAGVYDIHRHYRHEASRGVELVSKMHRAMGGRRHYVINSPTLLAKEIHHVMDATQLPHYHLIHGTLDTVAPPATAVALAETLRNAKLDVTSLYVVEGHSQLVIALMSASRRHYAAVHAFVKQALQDARQRARIAS
eukprot:TRINITY_DN7767_c0_g1_i4.p1 TRINITY_DN7767_c0_g1~~TRINITY_DN7767_c0_g1_i4.p1  ORF type:complete len:362 (+),score=49.97 TRINITY_DN7767_c0_g1_i4:2-1087(+)